MKAFAYVNPNGEKEALEALRGESGSPPLPLRKVLPLAGGLDLLALMKDYIAQPDRIVNVKNLDASIRRSSDGGLRIGAAVRLIDLVEHADAARMYPALVQAAAHVGTPQIRNVGTLGGNICQRPRCWYFRYEEFPCLKKGGSRCFAVDGENQYHAIFGDGPCHIIHPSSAAVPLVALGARFRLAGPSREREVPAEEFFVMPDKNVFGENVLGADELVTHVILPPPRNARSATYEVRFKQSHDWPLAIASVVLTSTGTTVQSARVVMGAVAPIPWRAKEAESVLAGKRIDAKIAEQAAEAALKTAKPMSENAYKVQIAKTAVKRAILKASGGK